jgi:dTDP-4-dehydrorhamnose 3,5-epimerase
MHFGRAPHAEIKLVVCARGAMFDVLLDLRPDVATSCRWQAIGLTAENGPAAYISAGFAHGFQSLADGTEVLYQMAERHFPGFAVGWSIRPPILSAQDAAYADFDAAAPRC